MFYKPYHEIVKNPLARNNRNYTHHQSHFQPSYQSPSRSPEKHSPVFERSQSIERSNSKERFKSKKQRKQKQQEYNPRYTGARFSPKKSKYSEENYQPRHIKHTGEYYQPIWQHLYRQGKRSQQALRQKQSQNRQKIDIQCTFQPILREKKRYLLSNTHNFLQRNSLWQESRLNKMIRDKQQQVSRDLSQCTFSPHINQKSKKIKQADIHNKYGIRSHKSFSKLPSRSNLYHSPIKELPKAQSKSRLRQGQSRLRQGQSRIRNNKVELINAKNTIRSQLRRIML